MDRVKAYSWLLTVIMGIALTAGIREFSTLIATPLGNGNPQTAPAITRFAIFLLLSIRWTLGTLWYFDRAYISKNPPTLGLNYFVDFFKALINFLAFVPLALTVTSPTVPASPLAGWLNRTFSGGKEVSTFIWILILLLTYDVLLFILKLVLWAVRRHTGQLPLRVHAFWALLNFLTLLFCMLTYLLWAFWGKDPQSAELPIFYIILLATLIDMVGTINENSSLSKWLSP